MAAKVKTALKATTPRKTSSKSVHGKSRLISSKLAYKGRVINVYKDTVEEPNGLIFKRDVIRHNGSVVVLAIDESADPKDPIAHLHRQAKQIRNGNPPDRLTALLP